ncbi:3-isopropylmalate dehydratase small subunit [Succinatimonas hippei]|uniref:3-isopropylmalate dehydratase small subunit n=1 Tax=Succinatimonas hippei (strain DSM 22608 / JCM 16073 / KCTC 15190 / YIT 12066) TaxID=762983 RepID=E8LJ17_SUCHY|nr:3-isopropylmalate dehydratase small subunit [Succinatimonas hippei]EFY07498.1 3-isopropylmalate dehydratase, small subunit [Succinatimonas hippei YIT 12066]MCL1602744.1 3-isopropylmalate dehydratase small subunit [Succinatimonas hippei]MDM8120644.1 3-isopropylmalate dehydratase small subunit [Succinatimonas hippei]
MEKFTIHEGVAVPLDSANIDTDQIIPKQFLLAVSRKGFGVHLFHDWRYLDDAETQPNPEFNLNKPEFKGASILVARDNFGNGSSREHAPWALMDYGIKAVIAPSFAVIFNNNALGNGLLTVKLTVEEVDEIFKELAKNPGSKIKISLVDMTVDCGPLHFKFDLDPFRRHCLLEGLDSISLTLQNENDIKSFEEKMPAWEQVKE